MIFHLFFLEKSVPVFFAHNKCDRIYQAIYVTDSFSTDNFSVNVWVSINQFCILKVLKLYNLLPKVSEYTWICLMYLNSCTAILLYYRTQTV